MSRTLSATPRRTRLSRICLQLLAILALVGPVAGCGGADDGSAVPSMVGSSGGGATPAPASGTVALTGPLSVSRPGWFNLAATASENVASVSLFRDGVLVARDENRDFAFRVPYTASKIGTERFEVRGFDQAGRQIASSTSDVAVNIGRVIYVSGNGSDTASGLSEATAKRTLQAAHGISQPGDSILVMTGIYSEPNPSVNVLNITRSGRADAWIAYIGYPIVRHRLPLRHRRWPIRGHFLTQAEGGRMNSLRWAPAVHRGRSRRFTEARTFHMQQKEAAATV